MTDHTQRLKSLLASASDLYQITSSDGWVTYVNASWRDALGYTETDLEGLLFFDVVHPVDRDRCVDAFRAVQADGQDRSLEITLLTKNGRAVFVSGQISYCSNGTKSEIGVLWRLAGDRSVALTFGHSQQRNAEFFVDGQNRILEQIARGTPLTNVLDELARVIEQQSVGMLCAFHLMDGDGATLNRSAAPSLPESYKQGADRIPVGPMTCSCGAAAYYRERIITPDIAIDPIWVNYRDLALSHGLRACWSTPIFSAQGHVLGTFAMYYREPRTPSAEELRLIELSTYLASIAIERQQSEAALRESEERLRIALNASRMGIWDCNLQTGKVTWSDNLERLYGLTPGEFGGSDQEFLSFVHPDDRNLVFQASRQAIRQRTGYDIEFRVVRPDSEVRWIASKGQVLYGEAGKPIRMTGVNLDITDRKLVEESLRETNEKQEIKLEAFSTELTDTVQQLQQEITRRQQIEQALRESEERYRSVVAALQEGIVLHDADGRIRACNMSAERILGLSAEQLFGRASLNPPWKTIREDGFPFPPETHPVMMTLRTGKPYSNVVMGVQKLNGTLTWISVNSQPLFRNGETRPYSVVTSFSDITARKQTETALRNSEALYRAIVEDQTELVCRFLGDGSLTFVNEAYCQVVGISREELLGYSYKMFLLALDQETEEPLTASLRSGNPVSWLEHQVILPNGEVRWHQWNSRAIFDEQGNFMEFQAVGRDITDRKLAEEELQRQNLQSRLFAEIMLKIRQSLQLEEILQTTVDELQGLLQADRVLVYQLHPDGRGIVVKEAVTAGWQSILGKTFDEDKCPLDYRQLYRQGRVRSVEDIETELPSCLVNLLREFEIKSEMIVPILQRDDLWGLLIAHQCDHNRTWSEFEVKLLRQLADQVAIAIAQSQLLKSLRESEEEVSRALEKEKELNELKSRFVSMISHEFRTPLTTIQSASELLEHYDWPAAQKQERFDQIQGAVKLMTQLLEDVLLIGRAESGNLQVKPELINLADFCQRLIADLQLTTSSGQQFTFIYQGDQHEVWLDPKLIRQILNNLLSNAVKYSPAGSNIELGLLTQPNSIILRVRDQGIGVPPGDRERLFEAFYRATNVDTIQGTGLGLAIVKKCVDLYKGQITLESEVGVGTAFTVTLPLNDPERED